MVKTRSQTSSASTVDRQSASPATNAISAAPPILDLSQIQCSVCGEYPRLESIPCCKYGHLICSSCYSNLSTPTCPYCRSPLRSNCPGLLVSRLSSAASVRSPSLLTLGPEVIPTALVHQTGLGFKSMGLLRNGTLLGGWFCLEMVK